MFGSEPSRDGAAPELLRWRDSMDLLPLFRISAGRRLSFPGMGRTLDHLKVWTPC